MHYSTTIAEVAQVRCEPTFFNRMLVRKAKLQNRLKKKKSSRRKARSSVSDASGSFRALPGIDEGAGGVDTKVKNRHQSVRTQIAAAKNKLGDGAAPAKTSDGGGAAPPPI